MARPDQRPLNAEPGAIRRRTACVRGVLGLLLAVVSGCASKHDPADWVSVREITPAFLVTLSAMDPAIAADDRGRVALTFVTRDSSGRDLWLSISRDSGLTFARPVRANLRRGSVSSYPEGRPIAVFGPGGALAVAWTERRADSTRAVDLVVRASGDGGVTLGPPVVVNDDRLVPGVRRRGKSQPNPAAYHGFPGLAFLPNGSLFAVWLDERHNTPSAEEPSVSSLYAALSRDGGQSWSPNVQVSDSACACCRPLAVSDPLGKIAVAYRNGAGNQRDPALAVSLDGGSSFALDTLISADRWYLEGCPDQGPALTWNLRGGGRYAWYTGSEPAGIYLVPWQAGHGAAGIRRMMTKSLSRARRPRLAPLGGAALLAVEAQSNEDRSRRVIAIQAIEEDGTLSPWSFLGADAEAGWIAGLDRRTALACWVERGSEKPRVRVARLRRT
jgi:hypothetical protein